MKDAHTLEAMSRAGLEIVGGGLSSPPATSGVLLYGERPSVASCPIAGPSRPAIPDPKDLLVVTLFQFMFRVPSQNATWPQEGLAKESLTFFLQ